jgi:hypothetical protein
MHPSDRKVISLEGLEASLEDFKSESAPGTPQSSPSTGPSRLPAASPKLSSGSSPAHAHVVSLTPLAAQARSTSVSLGDLISAHTPIESYEAVAIVQGLCEVVAGSSPLIGTASIELQDVSIHADGTVSSRSTGPGDPAAAIRCMGQLLNQLLPPKDSMFLRDRVVEKATSSPPYYLSFEEFTGTLEYYERPGRAIQVRNVYERWQDRHVVPTAQGPSLTGIRQAAHAAFLTLAASRRALQLALVAVTTLAVVFTIGYLVATSNLFAPSAPAVRRAADSVAAPAPEPVAPAPVTTPAPSAAESQPLATAKAAARPSPPPRTAPSVSPPVARKAPAPAAVAETTPAPPTAGASDTGHITLRLADSTLVPREPATPAPPASTRPTEEPPSNGGIVYSASDRDVTPPTVLFSQLPGPSPVFTPQHDIPALEVYVSEKGTVDSVRAIARPRNIAESVVLTNGLSAAKAWRFRPATKDGQAVRYRLIVVLSTD